LTKAFIIDVAIETKLTVEFKVYMQPEIQSTLNTLIKVDLHNELRMVKCIWQV